MRWRDRCAPKSASPMHRLTAEAAVVAAPGPVAAGGRRTCGLQEEQEEAGVQSNHIERPSAHCAPVFVVGGGLLLQGTSVDNCSVKAGRRGGMDEGRGGHTRRGRRKRALRAPSQGGACRRNGLAHWLPVRWLDDVSVGLIGDSLCVWIGDTAAWRILWQRRAVAVERRCPTPSPPQLPRRFRPRPCRT